MNVRLSLLSPFLPVSLQAHFLFFDFLTSRLFSHSHITSSFMNFEWVQPSTRSFKNRKKAPIRVCLLVGISTILSLHCLSAHAPPPFLPTDQHHHGSFPFSSFFASLFISLLSFLSVYSSFPFLSFFNSELVLQFLIFFLFFAFFFRRNSHKGVVSGVDFFCIF